MNDLTPLWKHQSEAIERAKDLPYFALFHEMGVGKSRTTLEILRHQYNTNKKVQKTLIVAPVVVLPNWINEIKKYTKIPEGKFTLLEGTISKKALLLQEKEGVVVVNYDCFVKTEFAQAVIKWNPSIIVLDECHKIKTHNSKRTKNILKISKSLPNTKKYLLTGTPLTNSYFDLWSQFMFMDQGKTFGDSYYGFVGRYFINVNANRPRDGKYFPLFVPKKGIETEINEKIKSVASIVKKEDCLDLPPLVRTTIEVELSSAQKNAYKEMKKDFISFINGKAAVATIALTKLLRMQQILSGFLKMEDGSIEHLDNPRAKVLGDILEDAVLSSKVIIWSVFHEDYSTIRKVCESQKIPFVEAHGLVTGNERNENLEKFRKEPDIRVLISSPSSCGIGINLVEADTSIWYSRNFSLEQDGQADARNHRSGSEMHKRINRIDLVAKGTLDELIMEALKDKKNIAANVLKMDISKL